MASNGGTLHGVPQSVSQQQQQQQQQQHICSQCGLYFESASSLQVHHMHYHQHDSMNRWGSQQQPVVSTTLGTTAVATTTTTATITTNGTAPSSTTPTSSDTENNNQPGSHTPTHTSGLKPVASPQQQQHQQHQQHHTTIAAAADSSDNQPPTPQPTITEPGTPQSYSGGGTSPYHSQQQQQQQQQQVSQHPHQLGLATGSAGSEMHYPSYIHPGYDPGSYYSGGPGTGLDYGSGVLGAPLQPTDYKSGSSVVSSARYHPYGGSGSNGGTSDGSSPAVVSSNGGGSAGMSPQVVSSSNGVTVAGSGSGSTTVTTVASTTSQSSQPSHSPPNGTGGSNIPPTPSPSPIQCEKCGMVCESDEALNEHEATIHSNVPVQSAQDQQQRVDQVDLQGSGGGGANCYSYGAGGGGTPGYPVKDEAPASDILDLDSQKMVGYGPGPDGGLLPPMNSLHPLQSMQRHPMMSWHDPHNFMGPPSLPPPHPSHGGGPDMKHSAAVAAAAAAAYYHHPIKSEYSATPTIKSEYLGGGGGHYGGTGSPIVKNEYSLPPTLPPPAVAPQPTNPQSMKQYADEMHDNQLATSPSDFPSTTTPQESGSQYRTFEPATSSLPGTAGPTKGTAWKSNEARRPKTYNCTACNKWFTSSGHLKRHYNTTLHKNAVKSSGQPDPATLPISVHHHPGRDPNYANKGRRGGAGNGSGAGGGAGGNGGGGGGAGSQIQQPIQQPVPPPDPPRSPEYGTGPGAPQYGGAAAGFSTAGTSPGHQHPGSGQVVSSNQSPGFHHPYAGATSANGTTASSTSSAVPPNGVAGPSVQVSQPRGLQIYSNSSNSHMAEQMEQATHTITTILTPTTHLHTSTAGIPGTPDIISTSTRTPTGTHTPPTMGMGSPLPPQQLQQQPPQQLPPPPQHIISSMEPYHHPHTHHHTMHTISNPLTISTSIPSFQTILPEAPSYHLIIGNAAHQYPSQMAMMSGDGGPHQQWVADGGDGLIESTTDNRNGSLGFPRCSGGAEVYQGDTAPPFSPNVPDQYQRPSSSDGTTILTNLTDQQQQRSHHGQMVVHTMMGNKYKEYALQQHDVDPYQEQLLYRVATPQLGATAPAISPAPCSPSVTSTDVGQTQLQPRADSASSNKSGSNGQPEVHRCIECDKVFNKVCYLTQHNKTFHSGDKPYKCHRCGKRFPCNQSYEEHLAKHGGEKPFKCEQCPKQFNHKTDLRRHMCLHSGSKPYACEQCGKGFIRKDHMIKHSETHRKNASAGQERGGNGHKRAGKGGIKKGGKKDIVGMVDE